MPVKALIRTEDKIKKYFYQYISTDGKRYTRYYYDPNDIKTKGVAWLSSCRQRTAIKVAEKQKDECWFD